MPGLSAIRPRAGRGERGRAQSARGVHGGRRSLRERGAAAVEFALILPILLLMVGATIDFGRLYFTQIELGNAARDGVRLAAMGTAYSTSQIQDRTRTAAAPLPVATSGVAVTACAGAGTTATVTVSPQYAFSWSILKIVPGIPVPVLQGKASMSCI
jgi:Flp pilus assembly protein TadG